MSIPQRCPNPVCPFTFDPDKVPPGSVLACPQCRTRFTVEPYAEDSRRLKSKVNDGKRGNSPRRPVRENPEFDEIDEPKQSTRLVFIIVVALATILLVGFLGYLIFSRSNDSSVTSSAEAKKNTPANSYQRNHRSRSGIFTVTDYESGLWSPSQHEASLHDPSTQLWLTARARNNNRSEADLYVSVLMPEGDAEKQAEDHVMKLVGGVAKYEYEIYNEPPEGMAPQSGEVAPRTEIRRFRFVFDPADESSNRLVVMSQVMARGKLVVCYSICRWSERAYWEQRLMQITASLTATK